MAKRKTKKKTAKKKTGKQKKSPFVKHLKPIFISFLALLTLSIAVYFMFFRQEKVPAAPHNLKKSVSSHKRGASVIYEEPPGYTREPEELADKKYHSPKRASTQQKQSPTTKADRLAVAPEVIGQAKSKKPKIAIIIDDMGHHQAIGRRLLALDLDLSFSFLPYAPLTSQQIKMAREHNRDILLHMPMEPSDSKWDPGPNALYLQMSKKELRKAFRKNLAAVPMALGINNHMGSRFTENWGAMQIFLEDVKAKNLFFIDSMTSSYSVGYILAANLGIKTAKRDIFLDNVQDSNLIKKQLNSLVKFAGKHGQAIGIGHPHPATLSALEAFRKDLPPGVELVGVHKLVR